MLNWIVTGPPGATESPENPQEEEARLVAKAKQDRRAFVPLYDRYLGPVYKYCYRRLGSREAAEDATSEVFYKALAALPSYSGGSFRAWLFTIAHNVAVDAVRRRSDEPLDPGYDPMDGAATPEEVVVAADESRSLRALLSRLPDDQRSVMELRLSGLTGAEIAGTLDRSLGAVKMLQFRAMEKLRTLLSVQMAPGEVQNG